MSTIEKRETLIKEIHQIPDSFLDALYLHLNQLKNSHSEVKYISDEDFNTSLIEISEKYKEVWKALA